MRLLLFFTLLIAVTNGATNSTNGTFASFLKPTKRPVYKGYPYQRATHPVIGFSNGNRENEIFNFCGNPNGFEIGDISNSCFLLPFLISIAIPTVALMIVLIFTFYSACCYACCRMCLGQCCFATNGCCCAGKPKQYKKGDWIGFLIATVVLVCGLQLPFFITGIVGNSSMTVAMNGMAKQFLGIYPDFKEMFNDITNNLSKFNMTGLDGLMDDITNLNQTQTNNTNNTKKAERSEIESYVMLKESLKGFTLKTANKTTNKTEDPMKGMQDTVGNVFKIADQVMNIVEMVINILIILREVIFDLVLILPFIGGVLMLIGAFLRIHQLSVSFFPCAFIFSYIALAFVAYEYPVTTLVADGCVIIYNVLEGVEKTEPTKIRSLSQLTDMFSNTENLVNEVLKIFVDCEKSFLGDIKGTINGILDSFITEALGGLNFTYFDGLLKVCNSTEKPGIFYNIDGQTNICTGTNNYNLLNTNNTRCVYDFMNKTASNNATYKVDPLVECGKTQSYKEEEVNVIKKFIMLYENLKGMKFINQNVYWVNKTDFGLYGTVVSQTTNGSISLDNVQDIVNNFGGLIDPDLLQSILGGGSSLPNNTKKSDYESAKRQVEEYIKKNNLKAAGEPGTYPVYCADLDGYMVETDGTKKKNSTGGFIHVPNDYMYSTIACTPEKIIEFTKCEKECPQLISEIVAPFSSIVNATGTFEPMVQMIDSLFKTIDSLADFIGCKKIGKIASEFPPTICETYLRAETTLVAGLISYGVVLWILFIYGLVAIKRFNYANYLPVEKDDKRYYNQGDIELE